MKITLTNKDYGELVKQSSKKSPKLLDCVKAFVIGGAICCFGELLKYIYSGYTQMNEDELKASVSVTLIVLTAILTGLGIFDKIAKHAGAGTIVPITGFANAIVSPAMEFSAEGKVLGTGAKLFVIAGPVIAYGCGAAAIYGFIIYLFNL